MAVTRQLCPLCGVLLSNPAAHIATPELRDPGRDSGVWFCLETKQHLVVPFGWADDMRGSVPVRWVQEFLRRQAGDRGRDEPVRLRQVDELDHGPQDAGLAAAELVFEVGVDEPAAKKARRPGWVAELRRLWRNLRRLS